MRIALIPCLGQDFFPNTDSGQFILHLRARTGTRIEETARLYDRAEDSIHHEIPRPEVNNILDNIGLPISQSTSYVPLPGLSAQVTGRFSPRFRGIIVPLADYIHGLRKAFSAEFPA
ncbi:MAG TPA: hypothetical protein VGG72_06780 [Bryobacteraceae bacterium]